MQSESLSNTLFLVPFFFCLLWCLKQRGWKDAVLSTPVLFTLHLKGWGNTPEPLWYYCQTTFTDGGKLISKQELTCLVKVCVILSTVLGDMWNKSGCLYLTPPAWDEWMSSNSGLTLWTQVSLTEEVRTTFLFFSSVAKLDFLPFAVLVAIQVINSSFQTLVV